MTFKAFCIGSKKLEPGEYHMGKKIDSTRERSHRNLPHGPLVFGNINMTIDEAPFEV
jgi:hypothetical protein